MERSTLSSSWNRVARLAPVLGSRVELRRQVFRGEPWYVAHDPVSNDFFRLNPILYHLVGLLDGKRTVDEVWRLTLDRFGDDAPTQDEIIGLLAQLNSSNLLRVDLPPDAEALMTRKRERRLHHWRGQALSILFFRFPLFNPDRLITWLLPLFRPLLSKWGMLLWTVWLTYAMWQFLPHLRNFTTDVNGVLDPNNWAWMIVLFLITKAIHELGHGLVCKRLGGVVPEIGIIILVFFPAPYVDATSSWNFPDRWRRLLVAAAGMIFELAIAAAAALVWLDADPGSLTRQLAYNMVFLASVSTLLFNGNPLLRFDAYYMLSDFLGVANLYDRGARQLRWWVQRYGFGMKNLPPIATAIGERAWLTVYGIASTLYRFLILFGIFLFIIGELYVVGIALGLWSLAAWVLTPVGRYVHWLAASADLTGHRLRAVTATAAVALAAVVTVGMIPFKDHRRAHGIVESVEASDLTAQMDGFVTDVLVGHHQQVREGDVILVAGNAELRTQYHIKVKQREAMERQSLLAVAEGPKAVRNVRLRRADLDREITEFERQIESLTIRSPQNGIVVGANLDQLVGQYFARGRHIAKVVDPQQVRVIALVGQAHNAPLFDGQEIESVHLRTAGAPARALSSKVLKKFEAARKQLPHPAMGYPGGGHIATDPEDPQGHTMLDPHFELWLELPPLQMGPVVTPRLRALPGQRVNVRFTLARRRALLSQWMHRLNQIIRARLSV